MSIITRIGSNIGTLAARTTGLAALGIVGYDAHVLGKLEADSFSQSREAERIQQSAETLHYLNTPSTVMGKVKKNIFNFQLSTSILMPFEAFAGYIKGATSSCIESFIPLGLGITALFGGGKALPKWSALGLLLFGAYKTVSEYFGLSYPNRLNPPFK